MCGIWGISDMNSGISRHLLLKMIRHLMILSETRGKDASGIAVMCGSHLDILRKAMSSHELLKDPEFLEYLKSKIEQASQENIWITGHSRLVTNGTQYNPQNNQPVCKKNIALVHNGIIVNEDHLWSLLPHAHRNYEVDSEVILEMLRDQLDQTDSVSTALQNTYHELRGMASVIALIQKGHNMVAASNNGSLYRCASKDGTLTVFASEGLMLRKLLHNLPMLRKWLSEENIQEICPGSYICLSDAYTGTCQSPTITQDHPTADTSANINPINFSKYEIDFEKIRKIRRCAKCLLPETMPFISFDKNGVCNYCNSYKKAEYKGLDKLKRWNSQQLSENKKSMVSFSGGRDSSYGLHYFVKEMGIKPVAYCYDWGMVTDIARRNQSRMCEQLGIEFIVVSADIKNKRKNIQKNVSAWLKRPSLGMIPLFMAGDKHYFYYANKVRRDYNLDTILLASNPFEKTYFKSGYCGVRPDILKSSYKKLDMERLPLQDVFVMSAYYGKQFLGNPSYINSSLVDTFSAALSYYIIPHNYFRLFDYIPWNEKEIDRTLIQEYGWECATDTQNTWRIGDGTAPFYNYIYCLVAGFTENDTLRSNQIREGMLTREEALELVYRDNQPRFDSLKWYFDAIGLSMCDALDVIQRMPKLYER